MSKVRAKPLILIIEDEGLLSRMYAKKLEKDGYDCITAEDGEQGVKVAKNKEPDLILCDVMMPVKDGITALEELKKEPETKNIPVIMLSNLSDEDYIDKALEIGAVSYLVKNKLVPSDVVKKIKEVLTAANKRKLST